MLNMKERTFSRMRIHLETAVCLPLFYGPNKSTLKKKSVTLHKYSGQHKFRFLKGD